MNVALCIIAAVLAVAFLAGGAVKLIEPKAKLAASRHGIQCEGLNVGAVKAIGTLKVLAALGLNQPAALDIAPGLAPLAAAGLLFPLVGTRSSRTSTVRRAGQSWWTWACSP